MILKGKRTYVVAFAMFAYAVLAFSLGHIEFADMTRLVLEAAAFAGLRAGIPTVAR